MTRFLLFMLFSFSVFSYAEDEEQGISGESSEAPIAADPDKAIPDNTSSTDTPTAKEYVTPNTARIRNDDVIRYLKSFQREDEIIEIDGKNGKMNGLYLPENTGKPQGGVLILHDIAQHAHWPNTVTPIREYLPDYGWNTLSIFFDEYISKPLPKVDPIKFSDQIQHSDTSTEGNNSDQLNENQATDQKLDAASNPAPLDADAESESIGEDLNLGNAQEETDALDTIANSIDTISDFSPPITQEIIEQPAIPEDQTFLDNMIQKTEDGLGTLNQLGQLNVAIIANGYSANWATKMLEQRLTTNKIGYSLVLIDAKTSEYPEVALNESLAGLGIPILDIITKDAPDHIRKSKVRKGAVMRMQNPKYTQLYLPAVTDSLHGTDNMISRRIRGWLLTNAAGEEVPVKVKNY